MDKRLWLAIVLLSIFLLALGLRFVPSRFAGENDRIDASSIGAQVVMTPSGLELECSPEKGSATVTLDHTPPEGDRNTPEDALREFVQRNQSFRNVTLLGEKAGNDIKWGRLDGSGKVTALITATRVANRWQIDSVTFCDGLDS